MSYAVPLTALSWFLWAVLAKLGWYDRWRGYDIAAHFLAGYALGSVGALVVAVYSPLGYFEPVVGVVLAALAVTSVANLVWEWYEYEMSIWPWVPGVSLGRKWDDTLGDVGWVTVGGFAAALVVAL